MIKRRGLVSELYGTIGEEVPKKGKAFGPEPDGNGEKEGEGGAVAKEIEFVEFSGVGEGRAKVIGLNASSFIEQFFREDILGDEDKGSDKGAEDSEEIAREFDAAGEDDAKCERNQGEIRSSRVVDVEEKSVGQDGEKRGEAFDSVDERDGDFGCSS